jgi:tRNA(Ile)-lysidine synthase
LDRENTDRTVFFRFFQRGKTHYLLMKIGKSKMMKKKILSAVKKYHLFAPGATLLLAVSGGPDSMALLHIMGEIALPHNLKLHVAHLNHMMRGAQSDEEESFVADQARKMGLPCTVSREDVPGYLQKTDLSPEEGARILRYQFLQRTAEEIRADFIVTAHHGDDQAETVLLHLLRGAGSEGLAAMAPQEGILIRPMLGVFKEEILDFCREHEIPFCLDATNEEKIYTRNRIRLDLIPHLKQFNPRIVASLVKLADICREENDLLEKMTRSAGAKITLTLDQDQRGINFQQLISFHPALQRRLIRQMTDDFTQKQGTLTFDHTEALIGLGPGQELSLPGGIYGRREDHALILSRKKKIKTVPAAPPMDPVALVVPGTTYVPGLSLGVTVSIISWPDATFARDCNTQVFGHDILKETLTVRNRRAGDYFYPWGMKGKKKIKNYFIDEKIPIDLRDDVPLILAGDKIVWVAGCRRSRLFEVNPQDRTAVLIRTKKC